MRFSKAAMAVLAAALLVAPLTPLRAAAAPADSSAACTAAGDVWLVVVAEDGTALTNECVGTPASGTAALTDAGLSVKLDGYAMVSVVAGHPDPVPTTWDGRFWQYYHATPGGDWTSSNEGSGTYVPKPGSLEGWCYGASCTPPASVIPAASAGASASTSASSTPSALASTATSAASTTAKAAQSTASAAASLEIGTTHELTAPSSAPAVLASTEAASAADYLALQLADLKTDPGAAAEAIIALASSQTHQSETQALNTYLKGAAADYVASKGAGAAGKIAIVAAVMGENPRNYGGVDLVQVILDAAAAADGNLGDPFTQSLALTGLARARQPLPVDMVDTLLTMQNSAGAFGFGDPASADFWADQDSTGLAIAALLNVKSSAPVAGAITRAAAWAASTLVAGQYWPTWSPANTSGLLGTALLQRGDSMTTPVAWLATQQQFAGGQGLPATLNGTESDLLATYQGMLLFSGASLNQIVFVAAGDTTTFPGTSTATTTGQPIGTTSARPMPDTGVDGTGGLLGLGLGALLAAGAAIGAWRRTQ